MTRLASTRRGIFEASFARDGASGNAGQRLRCPGLGSRSPQGLTMSCLGRGGRVSMAIWMWMVKLWIMTSAAWRPQLPGEITPPRIRGVRSPFRWHAARRRRSHRADHLPAFGLT